MTSRESSGWGAAMQEIEEKTARLARLASDEGLAGILLNTQPNFSWLTGGRSNRIDSSRENGSGSLLVSARGERFVVANNIEMPRLQEEALTGLGFEPCEYEWTQEQAYPFTPILTAQRALSSISIGCDNGLPGARAMESEIATTRAPLTTAEVLRYRALGADLGRVVGDMCRNLTPDVEETDVARQVAATVACVGARAVVTLVAADDRIERFRHPAPTNAKWRNRIMVVICARREGLVASLSRIIVAGRIPESLDSRTVATARVFEQLLSATKAGATGAELFDVAAKTYAAAGFPREETRHHQGGAAGYRSRDWIAHPASRDVVQSQQAFAWNPSITGTKVEETALLTPDGIELLTSTPGWPSVPLGVNGRSLTAPGLLQL